MTPLVAMTAGFPAAEAAVVLVAFTWGAILGSFVNVVVHRVPRGESVVRRGSHCPRCGSSIRPRDNVPIIGWLLLQGRCRDCSTAISARYPLVEAACGAIAAVIAVAELAGTGAPLPGSSRAGIDRLLAGDGRLAAAWALHSAIPIVMLTWSLMTNVGAVEFGQPRGVIRRHDRPCPGWMWIAAAVLAAVTLIPGIGPMEPLAGEHASGAGIRWGPLAVALMGLASGAIAGLLTGRPADCCGLSLLGAAAGWHSVAVVAIVTASIRRLLAACRPETTWGALAAAGVLAGVATACLATAAPLGALWHEWCRTILPR